MSNELINYIVNYINEELDRGNKITFDTVISAISAYDGGAR